MGDGKLNISEVRGEVRRTCREEREGEKMGGKNGFQEVGVQHAMSSEENVICFMETVQLLHRNGGGGDGLVDSDGRGF